MEVVEKDKLSVTVIHRGKKYTVEMPADDATVGSLGTQLSELTGVVPRTMRLLLPKGKRSVGRIAIDPSSELYSSATLEQPNITPGIVITMMGATSEEFKQLMRPDKDERVLGFEEEENRRKLRWLPLTQLDAKSRLPKGPYTFQDFRPLALPLIQLYPSPERARAIMYRLASDPGIVAIMKKHKWQVGRMSELAPEGYVGVSPKCILGFNMNRGQEISLRLRTDDLEGFRKYASIKMTVIHELTHMIHDEHDEHFHALNKQLTEEAIELDWTSGTGHTLSGEAMRNEEDDDEPMDAGGVQTGHKLGGGLPSTANARAAAAQAALTRLEQTTLACDSAKADPLEVAKAVETLSIRFLLSLPAEENLNEPDPDEKAAAASKIVVIAEGTELSDNQDERMEPDPDESTSGVTGHGFDAQAKPGLENTGIARGFQEPDPDDDMLPLTSLTPPAESTKVAAEPDPDESTSRQEPDPDESMNREDHDLDVSVDSETPAYPVDLAEEIARIQAATNAVETRLQHAVSTLESQATAVEATTALYTLSSIVSAGYRDRGRDAERERHLFREGDDRADRVGRRAEWWESHFVRVSPERYCEQQQKYQAQPWPWELIQYLPERQGLGYRAPPVAATAAVNGPAANGATMANGGHGEANGAAMANGGHGQEAPGQ